MQSFLLRGFLETFPHMALISLQVYLLTDLLPYLFIYLFMYLFIYSVIYLFIYLFIVPKIIVF